MIVFAFIVLACGLFAASVLAAEHLNAQEAQ